MWQEVREKPCEGGDTEEQRALEQKQLQLVPLPAPAHLQATVNPLGILQIPMSNLINLKKHIRGGTIDYRNQEFSQYEPIGSNI